MNNSGASRIIKKYQNRRLYDTSTSTYIVLQDIKQILISGDNIKVIDVKTTKDVTRGVLLQLVLGEEGSSVQQMFSNEFLFQIIRLYGKDTQPLISQFMEHMIELFKTMNQILVDQRKTNYNNKLANKGWSEFFKRYTPHLEAMFKEYIEDGNDLLKTGSQS